MDQQVCFHVYMLELLSYDQAGEQPPLRVISRHRFASFYQACSIGTAGLNKHAKEWVTASEDLTEQRLRIGVPHNHLPENM